MFEMSESKKQLFAFHTVAVRFFFSAAIFMSSSLFAEDTYAQKAEFPFSSVLGICGIIIASGFAWYYRAKLKQEKLAKTFERNNAPTPLDCKLKDNDSQLVKHLYAILRSTERLRTSSFRFSDEESSCLHHIHENIHSAIQQAKRAIKPSEAKRNHTENNGAAKIGKYSGSILVVDDEELIRRMTVSGLKKAGFSPVAASSGKEAVNLLKLDPKAVDLVLLDMIMPEMDGYKTYKALKEINPNLKIVICSGFCSEDKIEELFHDGIEGFIPKPFRLGDLCRKLNEFINAQPENKRDLTNKTAKRS